MNWFNTEGLRQKTKENYASVNEMDQTQKTWNIIEKCG